MIVMNSFSEIMKHIKKTKGVSQADALRASSRLYPLGYLVRGMVPSHVGLVSTPTHRFFVKSNNSFSDLLQVRHVILWVVDHPPQRGPVFDAQNRAAIHVWHRADSDMIPDCRRNLRECIRLVNDVL